MRVNWTNTAVEHLIAIYEYIARDSSLYAQRIVDKLTRRSEQIAIFPMSGRMVPEYEAEDIREMIEAISDYLSDKTRPNRCFGSNPLCAVIAQKRYEDIEACLSE